VLGLLKGDVEQMAVPAVRALLDPEMALA